MKSRLAEAIGTWFGCGYFPKGPGTAGSAGGLAIAVLLSLFAGWPAWSFAVLAAALTPVGMWAAGQVARDKKLKDPQIVVVDEVLGQWITLSGATLLNWQTFLIGFVLFRLFDIWKPVPVRQLEKLPGGIGIVADDLMAGIYAAIALALVARLLA
jgi:phosphatidylglycerophosphatase A